MQHIKIYPTSIDESAISAAVKALRAGSVIMVPTDTVYALACDALNQRAVERLCAFKGINPAKQTLSVLCADISQAADYAKIDNRAFALLKANLPGPFTFILPASTKLPKAFRGRKAVGVRVPDNEIARALAAALEHPLMSTSVTVDEDVPEEASNPESLMMRYAHAADLMVDGGEGGTHFSTVVDCSDSSCPEIIRQGIGELN